MFWLSGPKSGTFRLFCSTYVSTFSIKIWYVSNLSTYVSTSSTSVWLSWLIFFCFVDQSWVCFVFSARPMFRPSQQKSGMFRLYRTMFRLPWPLFWVSWLIIWLSGPKSGKFWFCTRPVFRLSQPKSGMFRIYRLMFWLPRPLFWLSWLKFWLSWPKSGMFRLFCLT